MATFFKGTWFDNYKKTRNADYAGGIRYLPGHYIKHLARDCSAMRKTHNCIAFNSAKWLKNGDWSGHIHHSGLDLYVRDGALTTPSKPVKIDKIGITNVMPQDTTRASSREHLDQWNYSYNTTKVKVDKGYNVCLYNRPYRQMHPQETKPLCVGPGDHDLWKIKQDPGPGTWGNKTASIHLKKDCNDSKWLWDKECEKGTGNDIIGDCKDKTSNCHRNKIMQCNLEEGEPSVECLNFCAQNHGECDTMMKKYCTSENTKKKEICSCINSAANQHNPVCVDQRCVNTGYATKNMIQACPSTIDCAVYHDIKDSKKYIGYTDPTVIERCRLNTDTDTETDVNIIEAPDVPIPAKRDGGQKQPSKEDYEKLLKQLQDLKNGDTPEDLAVSGNKPMMQVGPVVKTNIEGPMTMGEESLISKIINMIFSTTTLIIVVICLVIGLIIRFGAASVSVPVSVPVALKA
jgi:hypothetical protein